MQGYLQFFDGVILFTYHIPKDVQISIDFFTFYLGVTGIWLACFILPLLTFQLI